jgi:hypothetical protein
MKNELFMCFMAVAGGHLVASLLFGRRVARVQGSTPSSWHFYGSQGVYFFAFALCVARSNLPHNKSDTFNMVACVLFFAWSVVCFATMAWKFFKARQQFTIGTLLMVTLGVAILCSAASYISPLPPVMFLATFAMQWARCRQRSLRPGAADKE